MFAALFPREQSLDLQTGSFGNILGGYACGAQVVLAENSAICYAELCHQLFFHIVCDYCYFHDGSLPTKLDYIIAETFPFVNRFGAINKILLRFQARNGRFSDCY